MVVGVREAEQIWGDWLAANDAGSVVEAGLCADEMTRALPDSFYAWFEAGLHSKAIQDWPMCATRNERAVALFNNEVAAEFDGSNPAAWNLGIAATATGDWATARRAWTLYGIAGLADESGTIERDFGKTPVRLNPSHSSLSLQRLPQFGDTEVVWCRRLSPAHAVVQSVPRPQSGHRFGDVVLHDGEPTGIRMLGEQDFDVFDELDKLVDSGLPTWQAIVTDATNRDISTLADLAVSHSLGVDNWSGVRVMCADCSRGDSPAGHGHPSASSNQSVLGFAGSETALSACLDEWLKARKIVQVEIKKLW
ncbi:hypothetical protein [Micropruina sp.]|uniref:tetratricopeptide repeat protein n=1 Tax=Micropruina sp. TaxID=2737536 RepID=UPI00262D1020|nr:hypothetical protein [Micropruina sp.]